MRSLLLAVVFALLTGVLVWALATPYGAVPPLGVLLDPADGLWRTARTARHPREAAAEVPGLSAPVTIIRDIRGVPHVFARHERDVVRAVGYVTAQDRLFQLDFIPRAASGQLSEAMGPALLQNDRFLRSTGMEWAARRNAAILRQEDPDTWQLLEAFSEGVNAYVEGLADAELPVEMRLLGYRPQQYTPLHTLRLLQFMNYDLSYASDDAIFSRITTALGDAADDLYPIRSRFNVPIIPERGGIVREQERPARRPEADSGSVGVVMARFREQLAAVGTLAEGYRDGKGSNNWAVSAARSTTGGPILAGDPHLGLTLPAIWYELHVVTPEINAYGVTIPGAPFPIIGYNDYVGWSMTNTGSDQIDHYALTLDETERRYRYGKGWRDLEMVLDTIRVKGAEPVVDTLWYAHYGPVVKTRDGSVAIRWTAHEPSRNVKAIRGFNHAKTFDEFRQAQRFFDAPMQNIIYADVHGNIAITSTGYLPHRRGGRGDGLLDGSTDTGEWLGPVPFEELPFSLNPEQGYLASANQQPADPTYPYYQGRDYPDVPMRAIRINQLLQAKEKHSVEDFARYQADTYAVQRDFVVPLLDSLTGLEGRPEELRQLLVQWNGFTNVDQSEPLVFDELLQALVRLTWDEWEDQSFPRPKNATLYGLLARDPNSPWFDRKQTPERESAHDLLRLALAQAADSLAARPGWGRAKWRWGDHHKLLIRHLTRSEALRPFWRGPYEFPGFEQTLTPGGGRTTTHTGSWRMIVDFSTRPPTGLGIYPGGQSGNPFSPHYDKFIPRYLGFTHYRLRKPATPDALAAEDVESRLTLNPVR